MDREHSHGKIGYLLHVVLIVVVLGGFVWLHFAYSKTAGFRNLPAVNNKAIQGSIDTGKYQAVFIEDTAETYFGKLTVLDHTSFKLSDVYYMKNNDQALTKLGCENQGPVDEMFISRDSVKFWENLKDDGRVVKAINDFKKANPNGQKC